MIPTNTQFVVDDVLHDVVFFHLPEVQSRIAQPHVLKVELCRRTDILSSFDIVTDRLAHQEGVHKIVHILFQRLVADGLFLDAFEGVRQLQGIRQRTNGGGENVHQLVQLLLMAHLMAVDNVAEIHLLKQ